MPAVETPAIVLRAVSYGESDRVVTLLGRATGRVSALARGARKSQKRFGAALGLGTVGQAVLRERTGAELASLERFEVTAHHPRFAADVAAMAHAAYACELAAKLCAPRQAEPAVYDWLEELLARLDAGEATAERLRVYELGLLGRLGMGLALDGCAVCGRTDVGDEETRWDPERGGTVCARCGRRGRPMRPVVRQTLARLAALALADAESLRLAPDLNAAAREAILEAILGHGIGPLKSLEFMGKMRRT
jgi:DNA repair protein RecO (recombination protein O)